MLLLHYSDGYFERWRVQFVRTLCGVLVPQQAAVHFGSMLERGEYGRKTCERCSQVLVSQVTAGWKRVQGVSGE